MCTAMASYDFIIVGGGTSGLVMASRLTENPDIEVLVVEAGENVIANPLVQTPLYYAGLLGTSVDWGIKSVPQAGFGGREISLSQGKALGGSSAINAQVFVPPSSDIIDTWQSLGNPGWTWDILEPYFDKIRAEPDITANEKKLLDINWAEGKNGAIKTSYPDPLTDPIPAAWQETFQTLNRVMEPNPFSGPESGAFIPLASVDPATATRSYAATAYWEPVQNRSNLHLLTGHTVQRILFEDADDAAHGRPSGRTAKGIIYSATGPDATDASPVTALAKKEVILAAGGLQSPKLLELSGIGDASLLESLNIPVVVENENVGGNLMDHAVISISFQAAPGIPTKDAFSRGEAGAVAAAQQEYATNHSGPLALVGFDGYAYLPVVDWTTPDGAAELHALLKANAPSKKASRLEKLNYRINSDILKNPGQASAMFMILPVQSTATPSIPVIPIQDGNWVTLVAALSLPFSRGSVHIKSTDVSEAPVVDPKYMSNPVDLETFSRHVKYLHTIAATEPFNSSLLLPGGRVRDPASNFTSLDDAKKFVASGSISMWHYCGTNAMLPQAEGGVVSPELLVYGTENLRVVDASIFPLIPRGNTQATVYAVAERAADLVKARYHI